MDKFFDNRGNRRYDQLQSWLSSPAQRARRVLAVTAAVWWPDGEPAHPRRVAKGHADGASMRRRHPHYA